MIEPVPPAERQILAPDWLAHRYDPDHDAIHFIRCERAARKSAPFLIDAHLPSAADPVVVRRADAIAALPAERPVHFIFHSAYCCSTLMANAFDLPGYATSFKEPTILNDMVGWRHRGASFQEVKTVLDDLLRILARPFAPQEAAVIKPSNLINGLATAILEARPDAHCIFLHAPLPVYLGSIAAKGMWGLLWVRDLLAKQLRDGPIALGFAPEDHLLQTDLQVAAIGWLAQHKLFGALAHRWPDRVRVLDSEVLLARPSAALQAAAALFDLHLPASMLEAVSKSDIFNRNAKDGRLFDRSDRIAGQHEATRLHADEIDKVTQWAYAVAETREVDLEVTAARLRIDR